MNTTIDRDGSAEIGRDRARRVTAVRSGVAAIRRHDPACRVACGMAPLALVVLVSLSVAAANGAAAWSLVLIVALAPACVVDQRTGRLPDRLLVIGLAVGLSVAAASAALSALSSGPSPSVPLLELALGSAWFALPLLALHLFAPSSLGFGDVKLAALLGLSLASHAPTGPLLALVVASGLALVTARVRRAPTVPFGPPLLVGAAVASAAAALGWPA
ncbi:MAG: prepilin peptidase [Actinomycetota bacterium]